MQLILLYGPPAVGKFTIAKELEQLTGIPLIDHHSLLNPIAKLFGWNHPERTRLGGKFRLELFETAAKEDKSLITTLGGGGEYYDDFIQDIRRVVEKNSGEVVFVRLTAPEAVLFERVADQSRIDKLTIANKDSLRQKFESTPDVFAKALVPNHLEIDTSKQSAKEAAEVIADHLKSK